MPREVKPPPPRKEPGLFSKTLTCLVGLLAWLVAGLLLSIGIEWVGMVLFWPEQGYHHAEQLFLVERQYLDQRFTEQERVWGQSVYRYTQHLIHWWRYDAGVMETLTGPLFSPSTPSPSAMFLQSVLNDSRPYLLAAFYIAQVVMVRLALIILSLSVFVLFAGVGLVDGLVERYLRRIGGGRESSNVYNLARKSVLPLLISACVVYISLPFSVHPAWVMLPFAVLFGFSLRMMANKLKKYF